MGVPDNNKTNIINTFKQSDDNESTTTPSMIGILGGVGPAAGVFLHQTILQHTLNPNGCDQGHLPIVHVSQSHVIPDRTKYVLACKKNNDRQQTRSQFINPGHVMADIPLQTLVRAHQSVGNHKSSNTTVVAGVPCNTFHAAPIWSAFKNRIRENNHHSTIKVLHMLEETVTYLSQIRPNCKKVGLLSTTGTRESRVYHDLLENAGYTVVEVENQADVHDSIYNTEWGIKATAPVITAQATLNFNRFARDLVRRGGAEVIIMGCTEIPFAFVGRDMIDGKAILVDPMVALSRALIAAVDPSRLKPLEAFKTMPSLETKKCITTTTSTSSSSTRLTTRRIRSKSSNSTAIRINNILNKDNSTCSTVSGSDTEEEVVVPVVVTVKTNNSTPTTTRSTEKTEKQNSGWRLFYNFYSDYVDQVMMTH